MKLRHLVIFGIVAFVVVISWFALEPSARQTYTRLSTAPPPAPKPSQPAAPSGMTSVSNIPANAPKVALPASGAHPPKQGNAATGNAPAKTPDKRDLGNPLAPASMPVVIPASVQPPDPAAAIEMHKVTRMLRDFRTLMGENPVGTNAEIMQAIMGDNPKQAKLGPPEGLSINGNGELLDHWGTPYFFHQLSADLMEIRSAGPDRQMYTGDDIVTR